MVPLRGVFASDCEPDYVALASLRKLHTNDEADYDGIFQIHMSRLLASTSPRVQEDLHQLLRNIKWIPDIPLFGAFLNLFGRKLFLFLDVLKDHPLGRISLIHEVTHWKQSHFRGGLNLAKRFLIGSVDFKFTLKREAEAYGNEYDYVKEILDHDQVATWSTYTRNVLYFDDFKRAVELGLTKDRYSGIRFTRVSEIFGEGNKSDIELAKNLILHKANETYWETLQKVNSLTREQYVNSHINGAVYQQQAMMRGFFLALTHATWVALLIRIFGDSGEDEN